jgi:tRNA(fMet)-specific endonuclease VapC
MLDTNICIYVMRRRPPALRRRLETLESSEVAISAIVLGEL